MDSRETPLQKKSHPLSESSHLWLCIYSGALWHNRTTFGLFELMPAQFRHLLLLLSSGPMICGWGLTLAPTQPQKAFPWQIHASLVQKVRKKGSPPSGKICNYWLSLLDVRAKWLSSLEFLWEGLKRTRCIPWVKRILPQKRELFMVFLAENSEGMFMSHFYFLRLGFLQRNDKYLSRKFLYYSSKWKNFT